MEGSIIPLPLLFGREVTLRFGGLTALNNVDFHVDNGEIVGLIGPNGAGKTSLFNVISGIYKPQKGAIFFENKNITGLTPSKVCKAGIARTFQVVRVFPSMSVFENIKVAALNSLRTNKKSLDEEIMKLIDFMGLNEKAFWLAKDLTLIEQKLTEVARALATKPRLLLLDEPLAGLNPSETMIYSNKILKIRDELNISIFWIEHDVKAITRTCDRVIVLSHGEKIAEGKPKEVVKDKTVITAYIGEE